MRRLRLPVFGVVCSLPLQLPLTKVALVKAAYMCDRKDIHDGWCPNIPLVKLAALQDVAKAGEDALGEAERILRWFRRSCAEALDKMDHAGRVKFLGVLDVGVAEVLLRKQTVRRVPMLFREALRMHKRLASRWPDCTPPPEAEWQPADEAAAAMASQTAGDERLRLRAASSVAPKLIEYDSNFRNISSHDVLDPPQVLQEWRFQDFMHQTLHGSSPVDVIDEARHALYVLLRRPAWTTAQTCDQVGFRRATHREFGTRRTHSHNEAQETAANRPGRITRV